MSFLIFFALRASFCVSFTYNLWLKSSIQQQGDKKITFPTYLETFFPLITGGKGCVNVHHSFNWTEIKLFMVFLQLLVCKDMFHSSSTRQLFTNVLPGMRFPCHIDPIYQELTQRVSELCFMPLWIVGEMSKVLQILCSSLDEIHVLSDDNSLLRRIIGSYPGKSKGGDYGANDHKATHINENISMRLISMGPST